MHLHDLPAGGRIEDRRRLRGRVCLRIRLTLILGLIGWVLGTEPRVVIGVEMMSQNEQTQQKTDAGRSGPAGMTSDEMRRWVSAIVGSTEVEWKDVFAQAGKTYQPPTVVMFSGTPRSACEFAQAAMGPFYCPIDQKVYLDVDFFQNSERFRDCDAGSKSCRFFSYAYVIAREIGHHVQNQLGILGKVQEAQRGMEKADANALQVRVELQADCFAGVWANRRQARWHFIEPGNVEAALQTASAMGDDQTHGTSAQRMHWFMTGLKLGQVASCDTFRATQL
jgi:uncharacterized protein